MVKVYENEGLEICITGLKDEYKSIYLVVESDGFECYVDEEQLATAYGDRIKSNLA